MTPRPESLGYAGGTMERRTLSLPREKGLEIGDTAPGALVKTGMGVDDRIRPHRGILSG
jgi:hypothetical protein